MNCISPNNTQADNHTNINLYLKNNLNLIDIYKRQFDVLDAQRLPKNESQKMSKPFFDELKSRVRAPPSFQSWDKLKKAETRQEGWDLLVASIHQEAHQAFVTVWGLGPLSPFASIKERMEMIHENIVRYPEWIQYIQIDMLYETAYTAEQLMMEINRHAADYTVDDYLLFKTDFGLCQVYILGLLKTKGDDHKVRWEVAVSIGKLFSSR